jgi:hypothetical protein
MPGPLGGGEAETRSLLLPCRAYVIADNRLAEKAGWDRNLLALELQELSVEPNFDVR